MAIAERLERAGFEAWCVGGAIRDALLGSARDDVDLATSARPEEVQRLFKRTVPVGLKFGTVGVLDARRQLHEVTTFRRDVETDGRHAVVEYGVSLDDDLARRDFTINAIAYHPTRREWRDPFDGAGDLERRVLRAVGDPAARFREDYLRILRALRFAARLEFAIEPPTWEAARAAAPGLAQLSAERVRDEWLRSLETARSIGKLVALWHESGAAAVVIPELMRPCPLAVDAPEPRDPILLTALLVGTPARVLERLRASGAEIDRVLRMERAPAEPVSGAAVDVRRWLSEAGPAADDCLARVALTTGAPAFWADTVAGIRERGEPLARGDLAITGDDLRRAGFPPGPAMGRVLQTLLDRVLEDPSLNRPERLLELARLDGSAQ
ncbi:MAG: CCA tRNA nucleotidyltransferase [Gemmatimonadales bacterium]